MGQVVIPTTRCGERAHVFRKFSNCSWTCSPVTSRTGGTSPCICRFGLRFWPLAPASSASGPSASAIASGSAAARCRGGVGRPFAALRGVLGWDGDDLCPTEDMGSGKGRVRWWKKGLDASCGLIGPSCHAWRTLNLIALLSQPPPCRTVSRLQYHLNTAKIQSPASTDSSLSPGAP